MIRRAAFTLVEVLVAVALTAALVAAGLGAMGPMTDFWERAMGRLTIESEAQRVLDLLERDLSSVVWRRDGAVWFGATIQPDEPPESGYAGVAGETWAADDPGRGKPGAAEGSFRLRSSLAGCRFGQAGVWLRFFSSSTFGGPVAVSYQLVRRRPHASMSAAYQLFRAEVPAGVCFDTGYDLRIGSAYHLGDATPGAAGNIRRPAVEALLADRVIDFGLRLFVPDGEGPPAVLFPLDDNWVYQADAGAEFPVEVEIVLRVMTPEGARLLAAYESGSGFGRDGEWWTMAERHSSVFTRRIILPSRALP